MISRVTQSTLTRDLLSQVRRLQRDLAGSQETVATQRRVREASDDPTGAARLVRLRSESSELDTLGDSVGFGVSVLGAQDSALDQASRILVRAREVAVQHANEISTPEARQQAAEEIEELERGLLTLANTQVAGRHVFGGLASEPAPFTQFDDPAFDPAAPYVGPAEDFHLRIGPDSNEIRLTTAGDGIFGEAVAALDELRNTLASGNAPSASLDPLESAAETIRAERASVGGRMRRLQDRSREILDSAKTAQQEIGRVEDADTVEAIVELQRLQVALQAALQSSRQLQTSILDYL